MKIKKTCQRCGKEFRVYESNQNSSIFCGLECCYKPRELIIRKDRALVLLSQEKFAIIDLCDVERVGKYNWSLHKRNNNLSYARKNKGLLLHRFILNITDPKIQIDHIDNNGLNNRRNNLRICTQSQNCMNKRAEKGTSIYKGVYWKKQNKKWGVSILYENKKIHLGYFNDEKMAAKFYNQAAKKYFGEFARLNQIQNLQMVQI